MPRPSRLTEKRRELLPALARAFVELGYRRATTAELAARCDVQENILYRLWPDKKAMFLAAIDYVYEFSEQTWMRLLAGEKTGGNGALRLLEFESKHQGEFGHYRIIFSGLGETDDAEIRDALRRLFARFHRFLLAQILAQRESDSRRNGIEADRIAWAMIGVGTIVNVGRELGMLNDSERKRLIGDVGRELLAERAL